MKYLDLEVFWHVVIFRKKVNISFFKENVNQVFPQNIFERLNGGQWKPHVNAPAVPVQEHSYVFPLTLLTAAEILLGWRPQCSTYKKKNTIG